MPDIWTREELERRLDELCEQYLKGRTKEIQKEIIELARRLDELKEGKKKKRTNYSPAGMRTNEDRRLGSGDNNRFVRLTMNIAAPFPREL